jgi:hypothetical protein
MPAVRQQSPWLVSCVSAVAIAGLVSLVHRPPITLVAPPDIPGVSEWIAITIARAAHAAPVAAWMAQPDAATLQFELSGDADAAHPRQINLVIVNADTGRPVQAVKLGC